MRKYMNKKINFTLLIMVLISSNSLVAETPADDREAFTRDQINTMDGGDLCPLKSNAKYHHHFVLVDTTSLLDSDQLNLVKRLVLSDEYLAQMKPWDKLTIMRLYDVRPAENKPLFSKCRPRSGDPKSPYKIDQYNVWTEAKTDLTLVYNNLFLDGVQAALDEIYQPKVLNSSSNQNTGSPILGQIKEISRLPDLDFTPSSGYESRTLTIVSDLAQNTDKLPFYDLCPGAKKCPSWEKFKKNRKYRLWVKKSIPKFGENINVNIVYLNSNWDVNIDKEILEFWFDYFEDAGIEDIDFDIETESSNANASD